MTPGNTGHTRDQRQPNGCKVNNGDVGTLGAPTSPAAFRSASGRRINDRRSRECSGREHPIRQRGRHPPTRPKKIRLLGDDQGGDSSPEYFASEVVATTPRHRSTALIEAQTLVLIAGSYGTLLVMWMDRGWNETPRGLGSADSCVPPLRLASATAEAPRTPSIRHLHAGWAGDQGLVFVDELQPLPLAGFCLIGSIGACRTHRRS